MSNFKFDFDDSEVQKGLDKLARNFEDVEKRALLEMADTLLTLSRFEVPHDTGALQKSGSVFSDSQGTGVAYNIEYAAYQHEGVRKDGTHVINNYQKGRKGKYLEDPLKMNISQWEKIIKKVFEDYLK